MLQCCRQVASYFHLRRLSALTKKHLNAKTGRFLEKLEKDLIVVTISLCDNLSLVIYTLRQEAQRTDTKLGHMVDKKYFRIPAKPLSLRWNTAVLPLVCNVIEGNKLSCGCLSTCLANNSCFPKNTNR